MKLALYPGTFDPLTNGHLALIRRGLAVFDQIVVAVADNTPKFPLFSQEERVAMAREAVGDDDRILVEPFTGLTVEYAAKRGACAILRGLRAVSDFEYEFQLALMNRRLQRDIQTVFLMTDYQWLFISSTIVKAGYIGKNDKMFKRPDDLVIDGQQRLTALLAAMYGVIIKDKNYKERKIRISFNPLTREFAVWTQAYEKNSEWISEISSVFAADQEHNISKFRKAFIKNANEGRAKNNEPELTEDEEDAIEENINDLLNLGIYSLPTLKINSKADEEDVADIFVRVNSGGQNLTEKNFIETLNAVYDNDVHDKINNFCAKSRIRNGYSLFLPIPSSARTMTGVSLRTIKHGQKPFLCWRTAALLATVPIWW